jgi:hypothetical protein
MSIFQHISQCRATFCALGQIVNNLDFQPKISLNRGNFKLSSLDNKHGMHLKLIK